MDLEKMFVGVFPEILNTCTCKRNQNKLSILSGLGIETKITWLGYIRMLGHLQMSALLVKLTNAKTFRQGAAVVPNSWHLPSWHGRISFASLCKDKQVSHSPKIKAARILIECVC